MKIEEILAGKEGDEAIRVLSNRTDTPPDPDEINKKYNPFEDPVFDKSKRPDKQIKNDPESPERVTKIEEVNRIALSLPKTIINRAVSFLFGNDVDLDYDADTDTKEAVAKAVKKVLSDNYSFALNREVARSVFKNTEVAEYWYTVESEGFNGYGFPYNRKIRKSVFSAKNGDELFPLFDSTGDLIAFSRKYYIKQPDGTRTDYFETFTDEQKQIWEKVKGGGWQTGDPEENPINRIPIVYARQEQTEVEDVIPLIRRLNKLLSNFAEINDYNAGPKLLFTGRLKGMPNRSDGGQVLEGEKGSDAKYLSWEHAPESVKLEIETLINQTYSLTQTPDISFQNVKGISNVSGVALKLLFLDAHLKVKDKEEIFIPYLQRRNKIIASYLAEMNVSWKKEALQMNIRPVITPYMIDDLMNDVNTYITATGGKPVMSQKKAVSMLGIVSDVDQEMERIDEESRNSSISDVFGSAQ